MKNLVIVFCFSYFLFPMSSSFAQETLPIFDYTEADLSNMDTIPDYQTQEQKLKITGTIYENDGITPAKDVLLYIEQADAYGDFDLRTKNDKRYVHHRGWVKTNADGQYTFYTFMPGNDRRFNQLQQIYPIIKAKDGEAYPLESFLFDEDPLLTKLCRKKINKKGDPTRILKPKKVDQLLVVEKDIILQVNAAATK